MKLVPVSFGLVLFVFCTCNKTTSATARQFHHRVQREDTQRNINIEDICFTTRNAELFLGKASRDYNIRIRSESFHSLCILLRASLKELLKPSSPYARNQSTSNAFPYHHHKMMVMEKKRKQIDIKVRRAVVFN